MRKNLYLVVGVSPDCTGDALKTAYRKAAHAHHPDRGGDRRRFEELQIAYEVLSDKDKRRQYEEERAEWLAEIGAVQCAQCGEANRVSSNGKRPICGRKSCGAPLPVEPPNPMRERALEALEDIGDRVREHVADLVVDGIDHAFEKLREKLRSKPRGAAREKSRQAVRSR